MNSILDVTMTTDTLTVRYFRGSSFDVRVRVFTHRSHKAVRFVSWLKRQPMRIYHSATQTVFCPALLPEHVGSFSWVDGKWIDVQAEQRNDEVQPEPPAAPPAPERVVTEIAIVGDKIMTTCKLGEGGRPIYHDFDLSDDRADVAIRIAENHLFRFSVRKDRITLTANEHIGCPFCSKS